MRISICLFVIVILCCSFDCYSQQNIVLHSQDGIRTVYNIDNIDSITFNTENYTLETISTKNKIEKKKVPLSDIKVGGFITESGFAVKTTSNVYVYYIGGLRNGVVVNVEATIGKGNNASQLKNRRLWATGPTPNAITRTSNVIQGATEQLIYDTLMIRNENKYDNYLFVNSLEKPFVYIDVPCALSDVSFLKELNQVEWYKGRIQIDSTYSSNYNQKIYKYLLPSSLFVEFSSSLKINSNDKVIPFVLSTCDNIGGINKENIILAGKTISSFDLPILATPLCDKDSLYLYVMSDAGNMPISCLADFSAESVEQLYDELSTLREEKSEASKIKVTHIGDSTSGEIVPFVKRYMQNIGAIYYKQNRGGEQTAALGAYSGGLPIAINEEMTIPSTGDVKFIPVSTLAMTTGELCKYHTLGTFANGGLTLTLNPVSINGVLGNLSSANTNVSGLAFYSPDGKFVCGFDSNSYGMTLCDMSSKERKSNQNLSIKYCRICINAYNDNDVKSTSCHVTINGHPIELESHLTMVGKYVNNVGLLVEQEGYCSSDLIDIEDLLLNNLKDIKSLYIDGLASSIELTFSRIEDGDPVRVEKGTLIQSDIYSKMRNTIVICYLNNMHRTDRDWVQDYIYQALKLCSISSKYIFASTHFVFNSRTEEEIKELDRQFTDIMGEKYFNAYYYLRDHGIEDALKYGLIAESDIVGKTWKGVFLGSDETPNVHENEIAGYLLARKIIEKGVELGYWPSDNADYDYLKK